MSDWSVPDPADLGPHPGPGELTRDDVLAAAEAVGTMGAVFGSWLRSGAVMPQLDLDLAERSFSPAVGDPLF